MRTRLTRMTQATLGVASILFILSAPLCAQRATLTFGVLAGYQGGMAVQAFGQASDFASGLPIQLRVRMGRTSVEPGNAGAARRIFINTATNGTPQEHGRTWDLGLDLVLPRGPHHRFFAGIRQSSFLANFRYVGGNEDFDVTSSHWGVGAGVEGNYPVSRRLELVISGGAELYFASRLQGHDTSYSPDGDNVNPREAFVYADADGAVGQPTWRPALVVGMSYRPGR